MRGIEVAQAAAPREPGLVLSVGRLARYKGHHRLIKALVPPLKVRPDCRVRILGTGNDLAALRQFADEQGVAERVEIHWVPPERRPEMEQEIAAADLVVLLSDYEAHPTSVMEALAVGRPVVVRRRLRRFPLLYSKPRKIC